MITKTHMYKKWENPDSEETKTSAGLNPDRIDQSTHRVDDFDFHHGC